jgi:NTP pyrophosphatase (non-canonical NTP hydrolase)
LNWETFLQYIEIEDRRLKERYPHLDADKALLARTVKLSEEMGELSDNILSSIGLQRKEKLESFCRQDLAKELADLVITACLVAKAANIDIAQALDEKIPELNRRR